MSKKKDVLQDSKCLVTGYKGFIGSHLFAALRDKNAIVIGMDKEQGGVINKELLESTFKDIDYVFHLGAVANVPACEQDTKLAIETNTIGTFNILHLAALHNIKRVVFASSCVVYEPTSTMYAMTKAIGEMYCEFFQDRYNLPVTMLRFYNVYGIGQKTNIAVVPSFINKLKEDKPIVIEGTGNQIRDFIYVEDVVSAMIKVVEKNINGWADIGTGCGTSISDLAFIIASIMNKVVSIELVPGRLGDIEGAIATKPLWFNPKYTLEQGLAEIINS